MAILPLHSGGSLLHVPGPEQISLLSPTSEYSSGPCEGSQLYVTNSLYSNISLQLLVCLPFFIFPGDWHKISLKKKKRGNERKKERWTIKTALVKSYELSNRFINMISTIVLWIQYPFRRRFLRKLHCLKVKLCRNELSKQNSLKYLYEIPLFIYKAMPSFVLVIRVAENLMRNMLIIKNKIHFYLRNVCNL